MNTIVTSTYYTVTRFIRLGLRSTVARNAASLYLIHFANYVVPVIMVPYLVRALGPAGYGAVAFAQGLINYLMLFVEYGFDWSATRRISVLRGDKQSVNRIVVHVWAAKGLLSLVVLGLLALLVGFVPKLREVSVLLIALYGLILGNALFPTWLFQGMERMAAISLINLGMKLSILTGVFLLVRQPQDALVYAGLMGGGSVLAGLVGAVVAFRTFGLRVVRPSVQGVREVLKEGWVLFLSKASVGLYTTGNAFILGILTNHMVVGYYSVAEKIVKSVLGLLGPIAQAAYPRFSRLAADSKDKAVVWGRRTLLIMGSAGFGLTAAIVIFAPVIADILLGSQFKPSVAVIRVLSPIIFLIALSNVLGIQVMLPFGKDQAFTFTLFSAGALNVLFAVLFASRWGAMGMALAVLLSELFVTVTMALVLHHDNIPLFTLRARST